MKKLFYAVALACCATFFMAGESKASTHLAPNVEANANIEMAESLDAIRDFEIGVYYVTTDSGTTVVYAIIGSRVYFFEF